MATLVGCSKCGVPGIGILQVPILAVAFGGKVSVGLLLPLLIAADCFALAFYRRSADLRQLLRLAPWVLPGLLVGGLLLHASAHWHLAGLSGAALFNPLIGLVVLALAALAWLRRRLGDRIAPQHPGLVAMTGFATGTATTLANAAGPIMGVYCTALRLPKTVFLGTMSWFFLIVNCAKVPIFVAVTLVAERPEDRMITSGSLLIDLLLLPGIALGALLGRWLQPRIPQGVFEDLVLILAVVAALHLLVNSWL